MPTILKNISLAEFDPDLQVSLNNELTRQRSKLELIASENCVSRAVLEAAASVLTNKYAEGYPSKRYYGGCEYVDVSEELAQSRARELFDAQYVNVQPHSGSQANMGAYFSVMNPGDTLMGMDLAQGGHLTHGSPVNFSGKLYNVVSYGVAKESEVIDYDALRRLALKHKPRVIVAGASAYPRYLDFERFKTIADESGALLITDMAHIAGLVAAKEHPSPIPHSYITTTTTHKTLRGPRGGMILMGKDKKNDQGIIAPKSGRTKRVGELIDSAIFPGIQGGPLMHIIAAKAVAFREALRPDFRDYQKAVRSNARIMAQALQEGGAQLVSGGTDNHLILLNLGNLKVTGKEAEIWLDRAGITTNKNCIPFDPNPPQISSGLRLGTPALTSRGFGKDEMEEISAYILTVLRSGGKQKILNTIAEKVLELSKRFPLYPSL